jgi:hypothetical protein
MSALKVDQRSFDHPDVAVKETGSTGWGLFANIDYKPGDPLFWLSIENTYSSKIVKWLDSFGDCFDRGYTIVPDFGFCSSPESPFWNMNHSCNPNAGYVNWGRIDDGLIPIVAYKHIKPGEQITADYATFTMSYDGTPEGGPWEMEPCLCGEPNCRGIVTGFERLPLDLQMKYILPDHKPYGRVLAHIVHDLPELEDILRQQSPARFAEYQRALKVLYAKSAEFQKTIGPSRAPSPDWKR